MDESYTAQPDPVGVQTNQNEVPDVSDWIKKFHASEKNMKNNFMWKYKLAKRRIRAENEVRSRNSYKMTHFNVPLAYSVGQNFVNSVYFKSPECTLTAREEIDHEKIENTEVAVNDWIKDKKVKKTIRRCIWDAYSGGFGMRFIDHQHAPVLFFKPDQAYQIRQIAVHAEYGLCHDQCFLIQGPFFFQ